MLGWHITAYRFGDEELRGARYDLDATLALLLTRTGSREVPERRDEDSRLAVWQTGLDGTDWLDQLAASDEAAATSRGG